MVTQEFHPVDVKIVCLFQTCESFTGTPGSKDDQSLTNGTAVTRAPPPLHPINPPSMARSQPYSQSLPPRPVALQQPSRPPTRLVSMSNMAQQQSVSGHMITLPPAVLQRLNPNQKLTLLVNQQRIQVPPSMLIHGQDGVKLYLPSGIIPNAPVASTDPARPLTLLTNPKDPQTLTIKHVPPSCAVSNPTAAEPATSPKPVHIIPSDEPAPASVERSPDLPRRSARISVRTYKSIAPVNCFFQKLHAGYDCMPKIFEYLSVGELLRWVVILTLDTHQRLLLLCFSICGEWLSPL